MNKFNSFLQSILSNPIAELNVGIIGDSLGNGTSDGVYNVRDGILNEWRDDILTPITTDLQDASTGGYMPTFAERINDRTGGIVNVVEMANGGAEFSPYLDTNNFSTSGTRYGLMKTQFDAFITSGKPLDLIIIILGINDVRGTSDLATIESDAISLINRLRTDYGTDIPIMLCQLGRFESSGYAIDARWLAVRGYIDDLVTTYSNVSAGVDIISYGEGAFYDGLHLTQSGNNLLGADLADIYIDTLI